MRGWVGGRQKETEDAYFSRRAIFFCSSSDVNCCWEEDVCRGPATIGSLPGPPPTLRLAIILSFRAALSAAAGAEGGRLLSCWMKETTFWSSSVEALSGLFISTDTVRSCCELPKMPRSPAKDIDNA